MSENTARSECFCVPVCFWSCSISRVSNCFSSAVSHLALAMPLSRYMTVTTPISSAGMASIRNIHCQPCKPCVP
ncbi:hypothetical protein D3C71_1938280 [compost metagenome]